MKFRYYIEKKISYGDIKLPYISLVYSINNFLKYKKSFLQDIEFIHSAADDKIIILNPKVASRSIVEAALKDPSKTIRKDLTKISHFSGDIIFPIREPRARFVSFWNDKIVNYHPNYVSLLKYKYKWFERNLEIHDFLKHLKMTKPEHYEKHFCLQTDIYEFLCNLGRNISCIKIDEVLKVSGASEHTKNMTKDNQRLETIKLLKESYNLFLDIYSPDVNFYKRKFHES